MFLKFSYILSIFILISCSEGIISSLDDTPEINANFSSIQSGLFNKRCISCHSGKTPSGGLDLSEGNAYNSLVNKLNSSETMFYIVPNKSSESYIIERLTDADNPMPPTGLLQKSYIDSLKLWINNGALNN